MGKTQGALNNRAGAETWILEDTTNA